MLLPGRNLLPIALAVIAAGQSGVASAAEPKKVDLIEVASADGQLYRPLTATDVKATVLIFLLPDCPNSNAYAPEINRIRDRYEPKKIAFYVVHPDPDTTAAHAKKHAKEYGITCPVLLDPTQRLVAVCGVTTAPEVAVLAPDGKVSYRGRIDDLFADIGKRRPQRTRRDLRDALEAILDGKAVKVPRTEAIGCPLPPPRK